MALVVTARNLAVSQTVRRRIPSKARLWVYDRRLELLTRAFTLRGHVRQSVSRAKRGSQFLAKGTARLSVRRRSYRHRCYMNHRASQRSPIAMSGAQTSVGMALSGSPERTTT